MAGFIFNRLATSLRARKTPPLYQIGMAVLLVLLLVQLVRFLWLLITPYGPVGDWQMPAAKVLPPSARYALFTSFDPHFRQAASSGPASVTSLQLTLFGTRMNVGSGAGSAIIAGSDGVQEVYFTGDEVADGVRLAGIAFDHVVLDRGGVQELLYMDQSIPAQTVGGNPPQESASPAGQNEQKSQAGPLAKPTAEMIKGAVAFAPRNVNGKVTGIVVAPQGDADMFRVAGFRDGDIIIGFNGRPIRSTADIEALRTAIRPGARLAVEIERGSQKVPILIDLDNS